MHGQQLCKQWQLQGGSGKHLWLGLRLRGIDAMVLLELLLQALVLRHAGEELHRVRGRGRHGEVLPIGGVRAWLCLHGGLPLRLLLLLRLLVGLRLRLVPGLLGCLAVGCTVVRVA